MPHTMIEFLSKIQSSRNQESKKSLVCVAYRNVNKKCIFFSGGDRKRTNLKQTKQSPQRCQKSYVLQGSIIGCKQLNCLKLENMRLKNLQHQSGTN